MKIRPRNIPKFQNGSTFNLNKWILDNPGYYKWYSSIYPNALVLLGNPLKQRNDLWNKNQLSSSHYTTDDLLRSAYNNYLYTNDYESRLDDLVRWGESLKDFGTISDQEFVRRYNELAKGIRDVREAPLTYNTPGYRETNQNFRNMFYNRSRLGTNTPLYTIGYQENIDDIEGTSTWQRRMDREEKPFNLDTPEGQLRRTFFITRPNGTKIKVFKKLNGDIGLFNDPNDPESPKTPLGDQIPPGELPEVTVTAKKPLTSVPTGHQGHYGFDWNKLRNGLSKALNNPNLYALGRLAGNLYNNERVYDEQLKGIKPALKLTYNTHRQVVGDEATKQAYYRRAAAGQTKASRPFTSDADRLMAYQMEARRVGDELRAQGDLADNAEIRRTSDESNQHQWANTLRATEVANYNNAAINLANALKHNLLAQKHSAQWSSIDNYLKGIEYRKRQLLAEQLALDDQIFALLLLDKLSNDSRIISGRKTLQSVLDKHKNSDGTYDYDNEEVKNAIRNWKSLLTLITIEAYRKKLDYYKNRNNIIFSKSGSKITHKKKDDLLYKSTKDVVEHFRKMSKLSSDALNRKKPKIEKLTPHPKGNSRRKYQQGGVAPFTIYTPVALGGETTSQTAVSSGSSKSSSSKSGENDTLDMIKELFKAVLGKGLPSDVNRLYTSMLNLFSRALAFGEEISSDDIASMYLSQMQELNKIEYLKNNFDKAKEKMISNDGVNEIAVNAAGQIVTQDKDGKIKYAKSLADAEEKGLTPLTNGQVADLRSLVPSLAGRTDLDDVLANGIGLSKIAAHIKNLIPSIGTDKLTLEGYTKVQAGQILKGFEALLNAPDGDYSYEKNTETLKRQRAAALGYITTMLPRNMKAVLKVNADLQGVKPNEILEMLITSGDSTTQSIKFTPVTGKAAKDSNGNSSSGNLNGDIKSNFLDLILRDLIGTPRKFSIITRDGNSELYSLNSKYISQLPNVGEDMSIEKMLNESKVGSILDSRLGITFGDLIIAPENLRDIMFDIGGGATIVTLPCKWENGHKVVNFSIKDSFDEAVKEVGKTIPIDYQDSRFLEALAKKLKEKNLDSLLRGNSLDPNMFGHFMVVSAYTTDKVKFNTDSRYVEKVKNPNKALEERMSRALSSSKDKNDYSIDVDDKWRIFEWTSDDVYRGSVFIPLNNDPVSAQTGWGNDNIKLDETRDLAELYQTWSKMNNIKESKSSLL